MPNTNLPAVYVLATLDTKGVEAAYLVDRLRQCGVATRLVDVGCLGKPKAAADISRGRIFSAAGANLAQLVAGADRGAAISAAASGARTLVAADYARGEVAGVLSLGGSAGTTIGTAAMRALPWGAPKVMVSTLASGQVRQFVGNKDIFMLNSVVDIAGVNRLSRPVLDGAARAMAGLVNLPADTAVASDKPLVAATMFGVTTPCVEHARAVLEQAGFEVVVFHATGVGGEVMESLTREGLIRGVLDITTTELADELVGGFLSAGPTRLSAAAECGVPQVVSVGATDMVNFYGPESVPDKFRGRRFHQHNANVTLMRTTPEENSRLGAEIGRRVAASRGPASIYFPLAGVSAIDGPGGAFDDPAAREALLAGLEANRGAVELVRLDCHINDPAFAAAAARRLIELMAARTGASSAR
ncbi:MAG TPA: Tm-1-like ATP-binding domain-containing protein [Pirellulales bacterium]|jgi:uncharacterized protein (UPF0261 family)|nr:Tm-1-like ATP-binding domain-containing protein [Pirellulales bacterium]